ncbi:glycosyltransferase [Alterisphingorhabdus coralli]|uniref:Glycosyltransferase n=1 Tax=Alterisphingorhabdus coralli TaxID=3071408 RepID=A0AA97I0J9_9SPHN|nr:glycosyltransferase [Parasphingorhabdus sp. SCSIO 66989]WOE74280.1 glycosyltransferase [Parasphingorhabdus sp. SCSIO 66989]
MRILTLATLYPNPSKPNFGIFVARQTEKLASLPDIDVTVINPVSLPPFPLSRLQRFRYAAQLSGDSGAPADKGGPPVHRIAFQSMPGMAARNNAASIARAVIPLAKKLHARQPFDLIDAEFFYPDGPATALLAKELGIPYTIKARGADVHYWGAQPASLKQMLPAADGAAALLAVSEALAQDMAALGMERDKIHVHYTGCDQERFRPDAEHSIAPPFADGTPYAITVGALIPRKNPHLIIEALKAVPGLHHIFAGDGEERERLEKQAVDLGLAERVHFLGSVAHDALPGLLADAKMLVLPSQSEGLANAWVEALACGTPIVISEAGGARELVRDPLAGRIVNQTPEAIAAAMQELLAQPSDPEAVRKTVAKFTWERNAEELRAIFASAIG